MKNSGGANDRRAEDLSAHLAETDENLLDRAYMVDDAEKLRAYVNGQNSSRTAWLKRPTFRGIAAAAACLILVVALLPFLHSNSNSGDLVLSYDGVQLSKEKVAVTQSLTPMTIDLRGVTPVGIPLEFRAEEAALVSVSDGNLFGLSEDGEAVLSLGQSYEITGDTTLWWAVTDGPGLYEMRVLTKGKEATYVLELESVDPAESTAGNDTTHYILNPAESAMRGYLYKK